MRTLARPFTDAQQAWLDRRRRLGQDLYDEVWEGTYKVAPAPNQAHGRVDHQLARLLGPHADAAGLYGTGPINVGEPSDYRVPDQAYCREQRSVSFVPTVVVAVEILSPGDESRVKLGFYFTHGVQEVVLVDPQRRAVEWLARGGHGFVPASGSTVLGVTADWLTLAIDWPPTAP